MDTLRIQLGQISGVLGSYGVSALAFLQQANFVGIVTGLAGAILTLSIAYKEVANGRIAIEEARKLRNENDKLEKS